MTVVGSKIAELDDDAVLVDETAEELDASPDFAVL